MTLPAPIQRPFQILAAGLGFPEGPVALADGSVLLVEIARGRVVRVDTSGKLHVIAENGGGPNGAAVAPDGNIYVCNNGGDRFEHLEGLYLPAGDPAYNTGARIERVEPATGTVTVLYDHAGDRPLSAPNDIVLDGSGGFWFTDLGKDNGQARMHGAICHGRLDGSQIITLAHPFPAPNGIGLSPDGKALYVAETFTGRLIEFTVEAPGNISPRGGIFPGHFLGAAPGRAILDSLAVEANGNICVAAPLLGEVVVFSPAGEILERVQVPDPLPTNICFGGPGLQTAYITLSGTGQLISMPWPRPGLALPHQRH